MGISDFRISGQSLIKENCHNSTTSNSNDIAMNLTPATKLAKRNTATSLTSKKISILKLHMRVDLRTTFQVSSIILR